MKDVRLPCNSVGEPVPAIKWTKDRFGGAASRAGGWGQLQGPGCVTQG